MLKLAVGDAQCGNALFAAAVDAAQQMIIVDDRVRPLAKYPLRFAELCGVSRKIPLLGDTRRSGPGTTSGAPKDAARPPHWVGF